MSSELSKEPARRLAVLTCMDCRLDVDAMLGLQLGDAHVIRNAGGLATDDALRSLALSQRKLGTREVAVIHHTECGVLSVRDDDFKAEIEDETGVRPGWAAEASSDPDENVRTAVAHIKTSAFLPETERVRGYVYEVESGRLREVG